MLLILFFRGPLKYKHKGLIHFIVYTQNKKYPDTNNREQLIGETLPVLKSLIDGAKVIVGKDLQSLTKDVDFSNMNTLEVDISSFKRKYDLLINKQKTSYRAWTKTRNGWRFRRQTKKVGDFLRDYLKNYYEKRFPEFEK